MPRTVLNTCEEIMIHIRKKQVDRINGTELEYLIRNIAGYSKLTITQYKRALCDYHFLKLTGMNIFEVLSNAERIELESRSDFKI